MIYNVVFISAIHPQESAIGQEATVRTGHGTITEILYPKMFETVLYREL